MIIKPTIMIILITIFSYNNIKTMILFIHNHHPWHFDIVFHPKSIQPNKCSQPNSHDMYLIATSNTFQTTLFNGLFSTYLSKVLRHRFYTVLSLQLVTGKLKILYHLTTMGDWHLISPYRITLESNVKVMRIKEMTTNFRSYRLVNQFSLSAPLEIYREFDTTTAGSF